MNVRDRRRAGRWRITISGAVLGALFLGAIGSNDGRFFGVSAEIWAIGFALAWLTWKIDDLSLQIEAIADQILGRDR